jgi:hypothetical protein
MGRGKKNERLDEDRWQKEPLPYSFSPSFLTWVRSTPYHTNTIPNNQFSSIIVIRRTNERQVRGTERSGKKIRINYKFFN